MQFEEANILHYEEFLKSIGELGRYQMTIYFLTGFVNYIFACNTLGPVLIADTPKHFCKNDFFNQTIYGHMDGSNVKNYSLPLNFDIGQYKCSDFNNNSMVVVSNKSNSVCENGWVYDKTDFKNTIVTHWDLVCDSSYKLLIFNTVYFVGLMVGGLFAGNLSDIFGRKRTLSISISIEFIFSLTLPLLPNIYWAMVWRFIIGMMSMAIMNTGFVYTVEVMAPKWRGLLGSAAGFFWILSFIIVSIIGYFVRSWKLLQWTLVGPRIILVFIFFFLPESPRWLFVRNRKTEADKVVQLMIRTNLAKLDNFRMIVPAEIENSSVLEMMKISELRKRFLCVMLVWFSNTCVYYGLSLLSGSFNQPIHIAFLLSGIVEIPAGILAILAVHFIGRKFPISIAMLIGGLSLIVSKFLTAKYETLVFSLCLVGKAAISISFSSIWLYTGELFPTSVRNSVVGAASFFGRFGSALAPAFAYWADTNHTGVIIFLGCLALLAGLVTLFLPETKNKSLPDTMLEDEYK